MFWSWSRFLAVSLQVTDTHLMALFPGLPGWAGTRKVKPIWILLKQETVSGNGISRAICKSAPCTRQITTPAPHHSSFLQAGCPSCHPTNSIKVLKVTRVKNLAVGCHYFLPSLQLPSQPLRGCCQFCCLVNRGTMGVKVCLRLLPYSIAAVIWTQALLRLSPAC